jgi:hypothetical protein
MYFSGNRFQKKQTTLKKNCDERRSGYFVSYNIAVYFAVQLYAMGNVCQVVIVVGVEVTVILYALTTPSDLAKYYQIRVFASDVSILGST